MKAFKNQVNNVHLVEKHTSHLYLWTEKGALLHAKSLNTDKAWEVYDYLVDFYFRAQEKQEPEKKRDVVPMAGKQMLVDVSGSAEIQVALDEAQDYLTAMRVALKEYNVRQPEECYWINLKATLSLAVAMQRKILDALDIQPQRIAKK